MSRAMADGRRADGERRRQRVKTAIRQATGNGTAISVSGIARQAGVDRTFLYRHRDLLALIHAAAWQQSRPGPPGVGRHRGRAPPPRPATAVARPIPVPAPVTMTTRL